MGKLRDGVPSRDLSSWEALLYPLAVAAVGAVVWSLRQPTQKALPDSGLWVALLVTALAAGFLRARLERQMPEWSPWPRVAPFPPLGRRAVGLLCVGLGLLLGLWVVGRLWPDYRQWQGTPWLWLGALTLMALGGWLVGALGRPGHDYGPEVARRRPRNPSAILPPWAEGLLVLLILALGMGVRLYRLDQIPPAIYVDETNASLDALYILEGRADSPFGTGWYETPNGYIYYMAGLYRLFGARYETLKAASLIPALLTLPALYLLARYLFGVPGGLASLFFLAVSRWHMTMSRWGWNELMPPLFQVLGTWLLIRGLRERRARDYAWGGLITGLTLYTYLSSRLAIATIGLLALYWLGTDPQGPWASWKRHWRGLVLFGMAALVAAAPIGVTYITDPFTFVNRAAEINVFNDVEREGSWRPLWMNIWRHVQFFYQEGDPTGRQNLPGEPQVDPVTATLLAVGLAHGLFRLRDRRRGLLWMWLAIAMAGGYLSEYRIDSPNAYRTLNAVPAVAMLAGETLVTLAWSVGRAFHALPRMGGSGAVSRGAGWAVAGLLLALAGSWEIRTYFGPQAQDLRVQNSFNQTETRVANEVVAALEQGTAVYLSPRFYHFSPLRFLVYGAVRDRWPVNPLDRPPFFLARPEVDLPLPPPGGDVLLLLDLHYQGVMDYFRAFYPGLQVEREIGPGGVPLYLRVRIPGEDLVAIQGLRRQVTLADGTVLEDRVPGPEVAVSREGVARVVLAGSLRIPTSGLYDLQVEPPAATLSVDSRPWDGPRYLGRGLHRLRLVWDMPPRGGKVRLLWRLPGPNSPGWDPVPPAAVFVVEPPDQGLLGRYYASENWSGEPIFSQVTPFLLLSWPPEEPLSHPFSATFRGWLRIPVPGTYRFRLDADDGVRLILDGRILGEALVPDRPNQVVVTVPLDPGEHSLQIDYFQRGGGSALEFFWQPPGEPERPVPPQVLRPE